MGPSPALRSSASARARLPADAGQRDALVPGLLSRGQRWGIAAAAGAGQHAGCCSAGSSDPGAKPLGTLTPIYLSEEQKRALQSAAASPRLFPQPRFARSGGLCLKRCLRPQLMLRSRQTGTRFSPGLGCQRSAADAPDSSRHSPSASPLPRSIYGEF